MKTEKTMPRRRKQADRAMLEIHNTRQANLKVLAEAAGSAVAVATMLECSKTVVSMRLSGKMPISEKVARKIEEKLRLAPGWLDVKHLKGDE